MSWPLFNAVYTDVMHITNQKKKYMTMSNNSISRSVGQIANITVDLWMLMKNTHWKSTRTEAICHTITSQGRQLIKANHGSHSTNNVRCIHWCVKAKIKKSVISLWEMWRGDV